MQIFIRRLWSSASSKQPFTSLNYCQYEIKKKNTSGASPFHPHMSSKSGVAGCKADVMLGTSILGLLPFTEEKFLWPARWCSPSTASECLREAKGCSSTEPLQVNPCSQHCPTWSSMIFEDVGLLVCTYCL